jgi:outer membrane protein OmpA-like peptidoglycan-associated protein
LAALFGLGWLLSHRARTPSAPNVAAPAIATRVSSMTTVDNYLASGQSTPRRFAFDGFTFAAGGSELSPAGRQTAHQLAASLNAHPAARIRIEGYGNTGGEPETNRALSQARADAVKEALIADGVNGDRIETVAMGQASPVATNETAEGRALNRRVEVVIRGGGDTR